MHTSSHKVTYTGMCQTRLVVIASKGLFRVILVSVLGTLPAVRCLPLSKVAKLLRNVYSDVLQVTSNGHVSRMTS